MDEKETIFELQRLKEETDRNRNNLLFARGWVRSAEPQRSSAGVSLWEALAPEEKDKYEQVARGTGLPGSGIFFIGYRQKTV